jgi:hypothetical protein
MADRARAFFGAGARPFFLVVGFSDPRRAGNPQHGWRSFANDQAYAGIRPIRYAPGEVKVPAWSRRAETALARTRDERRSDKGPALRVSPGV